MTRPPLVIVKPSRSIPQPIRQPAERPAYTPPVVMSPVVTAQHCLKSRLEDRGESGYFLDGHPASLTQIMRAANRVLKGNGEEQVGKNPAWLV